MIDKLHQMGIKIAELSNCKLIYSGYPLEYEWHGKPMLYEKTMQLTFSKFVKSKNDNLLVFTYPSKKLLEEVAYLPEPDKEIESMLIDMCVKQIEETIDYMVNKHD